MSADADVLALLDASEFLVVYEEGVTPPATPEDEFSMVYQGEADADETAKVIIVPMPYLVYGTTTPRDNDARYSGHVAGEIHEFWLMGVGETPEQAKVPLTKARQAINRKRLAVGRGLIHKDTANQPVTKDPDYNRPGGEPIFYGVDRYAVAI